MSYPPSFSDIPAGTPPPGQTSNLIDPPSIGYLIIVTVAVTLGVTIPLLIMRISAKFMARKRLDWSDFFALVAEAGYIAYCGLLIESEQVGGGRQLWDISLAAVFQGLWWANIIETLYCPLIFFAKLSVLLQIKRIFTGNNKRGFVPMACNILMWGNGMFYLAQIFATVFACNPRAKAWDPLLSGTCVNQNAVVLSNGSLNVVSDALILALPIAATLRLTLPFDKKVKVCAIFAFGAFGLAAGVLRLVASVNLVQDSTNFSYILVPLGCWSMGEIATVIAAGCMPSIPQFSSLLGKRLRSTKGSSYPSYGSDQKPSKGGVKASALSSNTAYTNGTNGSVPRRKEKTYTFSCSITVSKKPQISTGLSQTLDEAPRPVDLSGTSYQSSKTIGTSRAVDTSASSYPSDRSKRKKRRDRLQPSVDTSLATQTTTALPEAIEEPEYVEATERRRSRLPGWLSAARGSLGPNKSAITAPGDSEMSQVGQNEPEPYSEHILRPAPLSTPKKAVLTPRSPDEQYRSLRLQRKPVGAASSYDDDKYVSPIEDSPTKRTFSATTADYSAATAVGRSSDDRNRSISSQAAGPSNQFQSLRSHPPSTTPAAQSKAGEIRGGFVRGSAEEIRSLSSRAAGDASGATVKTWVPRVPPPTRSPTSYDDRPLPPFPPQGDSYM